MSMELVLKKYSNTWNAHCHIPLTGFACLRLILTVEDVSAYKLLILFLKFALNVKNPGARHGRALRFAMRLILWIKLVVVHAYTPCAQVSWTLVLHFGMFGSHLTFIGISRSSWLIKAEFPWRLKKKHTIHLKIVDYMIICKYTEIQPQVWDD